MYYSEERNEMHPLMLVFMAVLSIHFLEQALPFFHLFVGIVLAIGAFIATWHYLGRRFLKAGVCYSVSTIWLGITNYLQDAREAAIKLATEGNDIFAMFELERSHAYYHNSWLTMAIGFSLLALGIYLFWKEWRS